MNRTPFARTVNRFEHHLFAILPLWAPSHSGKNNQVIQYCTKFLDSIGRPYTVDKSLNIIVPQVTKSSDGKVRAIVAHTDVVEGDANRKKGHRQSIRYEQTLNVVYNATGISPMGGDDKVGVAFVLAMLEMRQDFMGLLVADEEVGCVGSRAVQCEPIDFAIQLDRRDRNDIAFQVAGTNVCSLHTAHYIMGLVPHRKPVPGGSTDVGQLVSRGIAKCALNMSCGYYQPHSSTEYLRMNDVHVAVMDALTILYGLHGDMISPAMRTETGLVDASAISKYDVSKPSPAMSTGKVVTRFEDALSANDKAVAGMANKYLRQKLGKNSDPKALPVGTEPPLVTDLASEKGKKSSDLGLTLGELTDLTNNPDVTIVQASGNYVMLRPIKVAQIISQCAMCENGTPNNGSMYMFNDRFVCAMCALSFTESELEVILA